MVKQQDAEPEGAICFCGWKDGFNVELTGFSLIDV